MDTLKFPFVLVKGRYLPSYAIYTPLEGMPYYLVRTHNPQDSAPCLRPDKSTIYKDDYYEILKTFSPSGYLSAISQHDWVRPIFKEELLYEFPDNEKASIALQDFDDF